MNVSRSGNLLSALPEDGVRFGVRNHTSLSAPVRSAGSISFPPANSGRTGANEIASRSVWQATQSATLRASYLPRSRVGADVGEVAPAFTFFLGLNTGATLLTTFPMIVHSLTGTTCAHGRRRAQVRNDGDDIRVRSCRRTA